MSTRELTPAEVRAAIVAWQAQYGVTVTAKYVPPAPGTLPQTVLPHARMTEADQAAAMFHFHVTITRGKRSWVTTYQMGIGHGRAMHASIKELGGKLCLDRSEAVRAELLSGYAWSPSPGNRQPIRPDPVDVLACLAQDASVLEAPDFETWAQDLGYDVDSRKVEGVYCACLRTALQLRGLVGEIGMAELRELAAQW